MRRLTTACALATGLALLAPAGALAKDPVVNNDPSTGSPAGTIYQIPLDTARGDAAPRTRGGGGNADPSPIRSENNFGSSSEVPGTTPGSGSTPAATRSGGSRSGGTGSQRRGTASHGGSGAGGSSSSSSRAGGGGAGGGGGGNAEAVIRSSAASHVPSSTRTYLLIAAAVAVAIALAAAQRLIARRR